MQFDSKLSRNMVCTDLELMENRFCLEKSGNLGNLDFLVEKSMNFRGLVKEEYLLIILG